MRCTPMPYYVTARKDGFFRVISVPGSWSFTRAQKYLAAYGYGNISKLSLDLVLTEDEDHGVTYRPTKLPLPKP